MAKRNWDRIKGQKPQDTVKYRDVYEDQQLERGDLDKRQTMTGRTILSAAVGLIVMLLVWIVISAIQMAMSGKGTLEMNPSPENTWIHVNEHYVNVNDQTDVISSDMYNALVQEHKDILSGKQEVVENPGNEPDLQAVRGYESSDWERKNEGYTLTVPVGALMPDGSRCTTPTELFMSTDDYKAYAAKVSGDYQNRYNAYVEYQRALEDPANTYSAVVEHYRNRNDFSQYIKVDEYQKELNEFNVKKEKAKAGSSFADLCSVPFLPVDPSTIYTEYEHGNVDPYVYSPKLYLDEQQRNMFNEFVSQHRVESDANDIQYKIMDDTVCFNEYPSKDLIAIFDKLNALVGDRAISYKNTLDGTIISYEEYDEMMCKYQEDLATFKKEYRAHREKFHPDDIDGTAKVFDWGPSTLKFGLSFGLAMLIFSVLESVLYANLRAQNVMSDTTDINQYHNDQHIALPEEIQRAYDVFPDVGAHSAVQVSSMISHVALLNKGLKTVNFAERATKDIKNDNGDIEYYKGEILEDENGHPIVKPVPIIDNEFMEALFDASGAPKNKNIRKYYDATKIPYNPDGSNRDKLGKYATWADLINKDWEFPLYEPQRPAGAYIVDTAPVNTMVLAITRAGKGQTVIEPTIDMWMREKRQNNMVINDPKGELLVKNYVRGTVRGFQIVQFNLINAMKTDIYNPLAMAADAAREGDQTKCAMYVENIAEVFFPLDGGEDPVWPNAANNAFKRAAYGLIDYYLEEEKAMRRMAERTRIDDKVLEQKIDEMWGKVTLYNCYQLFVQLSSKKMKNPAIEFANQAKAGKYNDLSDAEYAIELEKVKNKAKLWEDKQDADLLTLYFSATDALPRNSMRTLVANANNALKAMGGADKMMASVYGIAITAMSFFTDPTISTLTSGTLNQNVDLGGLSFPRRFGVRFNSNYIEKYHFVGQQAIWTAYDDPEFRNDLGKDFYHEDMVSREGWARYYFDGKFKNDVGYVKLEIKNPSSGALIRTFYFEFQKNYQTSLDGRVYVKDPILEEKIIKNGILTEMRKFKKKGKGGEPDKIVFRKAKTTFKEKRILDFKQKGQFTEVKTNAITNTMIRYTEKPKMVFLVTPPHLMKYAKLILILIKQLVDLNFDKAYMTKSSQKPLYKTRFMLDELGNLQSEGHGISGFQTMLSIGLGQEQQFTLILQTLQQLRDVYGESIDKVIQGNTSNIVFLKSTDDSMLETLSKMSGIRHKAYKESKTITQDQGSIVKMTKTEGKVSYTMTVKEEPVISYNDMAFISERNSIVFRAGDSPIWNRNETILPMSWRLFKNTITHPGKEYSLQTIPTLSTAMDFDVRKNQPNFRKMLEKRMEQAYAATEAQKEYQDAYGYSDYEIEQLDPDVYSDEIMDMIYTALSPEEVKAAISVNADGLTEKDDNGEYQEMFDYMYGNQDKDSSKFTVEQDIYDEFATIEENKEQQDAINEIAAKYGIEDANKLRYAGGQISRDMIVSLTGISHSLDEIIIRVYKNIRGKMDSDDEYFIARNGHLYSVDGKLYIKNLTSQDNLDQLNEDIHDENSRVFADGDLHKEDTQTIGSYEVKDAFLKFLCTFNGPWPFADGEFDARMASEIKGE